jgi:hypothetical protein
VRAGTGKNSKRPRGRPALPAESVKRHALGIRTTKALKDALLRASQESGRSLAQEIEFRLEWSLADQRRLGEALELVFGRQVAALTLMMGFAMKDAAETCLPWVDRENERPWPFRAKKAGVGATRRELHKLARFLRLSMKPGERPWLSNVYVFGQVANAAEALLAAMKPDGDASVIPPPPRGSDPALVAALMSFFGKSRGESTCLAIANADAEETFGSLTHMIREWLGDATIGRIRERLGETYAPSSLTKSQ